MLQIINHFKQHNKTTYKEIAEKLDIKERLVRYDIDRINDVLHTYDFAMIEKKPKGTLIFPDVNIPDILENKTFSYIQNERISLMLLILLIDNERLKLNHISDTLQVSRATIKNDLDILKIRLKKYGIDIDYSKSFYLSGENDKIVSLLNEELKKCIYIFKKDEQTLNFFEKSVLKIITKAFHEVNPKDIIVWSDKLLEDMKHTLSDISYNWYVSNVLALTWYKISDKVHPSKEKSVSSNDILFDYNQIKKLEDIINKKFSESEKDFIVRLLNYTNRYNNYEEDINLIHVEAIVFRFISIMSEKMNNQFEKDLLLVEGLLNHMTPLILRIQEDIYMYDDINTTLSVDDLRVFDMVCESLKEVDILENIKNKEDIFFITIHFLANLERRKKDMNRRVLIVCGFGYGTTTMLRGNLLNEFQVEIVDAIPLNVLTRYDNWDNVDLVISTSMIDTAIPKDYLIVNQILTIDDCKNIENKGILKKKMLPNYYSLKEKLDFLNDEDKIKVLNLIQQEFGYEARLLAPPPPTKTLSQYIKPESIKLIDEKVNWKDSVYKSVGMLEETGCVNQVYKDEIIDAMENIGFYSVTDKTFALLHGSNANIHKSGMSLLINKQEVHFGDKSVNLIFCLASKDKKEHIPAVTTLMRLVRTTDFMAEIMKAETINDIYNVIIKYEMEVK